VKTFQRSAETNDLAQGPYGGSHIGSGMALGTMSTVSLNKNALSEATVAVEIYNDYFGPSQFKRMELTQQTACNFGQSWPGLVWIPICYYFDGTVRHQLGLDWGDRGYWNVVTPHEVAHQWWGHTVGFASLRDQWMSEGFADFSASLFLSATEKDQKKFLKFWNDEREILLEKDSQGFRAIDVGPLTMGYRANNSRTGFGVTRRLIYPKGAYVLHMVRMMMRDNRTGEKSFKEAMQDFVNTYRGQSATTEDFKAMLEKHMTREMDLDGNHKLDWFFNEYVYGTQLPSYNFTSSFDNDADGSVLFHFSLTQSNVDSKFVMLVPIYLEMDDGRIALLGRVRMFGNTTETEKLPLKGLKAKPRRAMINYYDDVLASP
jgi:Peptidase family M1 domain